MRPKRGIKAVQVNRKAVDSHEAAFDALNSEVMTGCVEPMRVESKNPITYPIRIPEKMSQNLVGDTLMNRDA